LCVGFPGIATGTPEVYTMAAITTILGGGMSSRLFQKIREEHGLAYSVYAYHTGFMDTGLFAVYSALNPAQIGDVMGLILGELQNINLAQSELNKTKEQLKSSFILGLESVSSRMSGIGRNMLMLNRITTPDELIQKIDEINLDNFYELCERIFKMDQMSISIVGATDYEFQ